MPQSKALGNVFKLRQVNVLDPAYGARGDGDGVGGGTNDAAAIQAAHDAIVATGKAGTLILPAGTYRCDSGLVWNALLVGIRADNARLDFTNLAAGVALTLNSGGVEIDFGGLRIDGNSNAGSVVGVKIFGAAAGTAARDLTLSNLTVQTFGTDVQVVDHAYLITFRNCRLRQATTVFDYAGVTNSGESINFEGGLLECNVLGGKILKTGATAANGELNFFGTSFDSDQDSFTAFELTNSNQVNLYGCHIESNNFNTVPITITGAGTSFSMFGGRINSNQVTIGAANFVTIDGTVNPLTAGAVFNGVNFNFGNTASGNFAGGANASTGCRIFNPQGNYPFNVYSGGGVPYSGSEARGTWTPALEGSVTPGSQTYTDRAGEWYLRGNTVTASFRINMSAKDGATAGNIRIAGLPFAAKNVTTQPGLAIGTFQNIDMTGYIQLSGLVTQNGTTIELFKNHLTGGLTNVDAANIGAATLLTGTVTYQI